MAKRTIKEILKEAELITRGCIEILQDTIDELASGANDTPRTQGTNYYFNYINIGKHGKKR